MSQRSQTKEKHPETTSEQNSQDLQETSQKRTTSDLETVALYNEEFNNFRCPICLDILRNTRFAKSCFHRFCKDCIITALKLGNKTCPVCRRKLISRRSLYPDPKLDELISKMFPSCNEKDSSPQKPLGKRKYKMKQFSNVIGERRHQKTSTTRVQHGEEQQITTTSGLESNNDSSPCCSNGSTHSSDKAGPSSKRTKIIEFHHDSKHTIVTYDSVTDGASETRLHRSLREEDDPAHAELATTSDGNAKQQ
ncbi:E3 ubiquitin-protein ligase RING2-like [Mastomys coucha]|uniref:E3 ubiquitin-protein ligase RING2-like n=1 Tax=Mastomys coucha TaxID=35658 RepID=UPI001261559A|nr:E3 ubiquitin-protein ligase RING2-like [Mastomys coucha]